MKRIDLHIHTTASDGTTTPEETVRYAKSRGLSAIAVTDHDTADGAAEAVKYAEKYGVEVVPGIEISADYKGYGIHILGYFIDTASPALNTLLDWVVEERMRRNAVIAAAMQSDGLDVSLDKMRERYPDSVIGRPHFAAALTELGLCSSIDDAFRRFLSEGGRYYRKREYVPFPTAFEVIHASGGKAVFAHPFQYKMEEKELLALTDAMAENGCVGVECLYSGYTAQQSEYLIDLAESRGLCVTGGSDFHGSRKPHIDMGSGCGDLCVPYELLERLKTCTR